MFRDAIAVLTTMTLLFGIAALTISPVEARSPSLRDLYSGPPETWPRPVLAEGAVFTEFGVLPPVVHPPDNQASPAKVALGERLFNERRLSGSGQLACASCHSPELGFGDGLQTSFGHDRQRGTRNAQPLFVVGWMSERPDDNSAAAKSGAFGVPGKAPAGPDKGRDSGSANSVEPPRSSGVVEAASATAAVKATA